VCCSKRRCGAYAPSFAACFLRLFKAEATASYPFRIHRHTTSGGTLLALGSVKLHTPASLYTPVGRNRPLPGKRKQASASALPPPAIASDRLLFYAILDKLVGFTSGHGLQFVDGEDIGKVPFLAICQARSPAEVLLHFCEKGWNSIAVSVHDSAANAKRRAEKIYPGSEACWMEAKVSDVEVENYLDRVYKDFRCSFCGKRGDLVAQMFAGNDDAQICNECVDEFHSGLGTNYTPSD
jgi:hypothetical protein